MDKYIFVLCIFLTGTGVHSLQCYRCNNCTKVESSHLVTCGISSSTTTSTTRPSSTTSSTTTVSTPTTSPTSTISTTTNPNNTTTVDPTNSTTVNPTNTTTVDPTNSTTTTNTTQSSFLFDIEEGKVIENTWEDSIPASDDNCFCENGFCDCVKNVERAEVRANETTTFVCVIDTTNLNGFESIRRDCAVKQNTTQLTCQRGGFTEKCKICETDMCNIAISIKFSAVLVISALILTFSQ